MRKKVKSVSIFLLGIATCLSGSVWARGDRNTEKVEITQQKTALSGHVEDAAGPLPGATIVVKGTTNGTITDGDGNFTLAGVSNGDVIQISYIGYLPQEITYTGQSRLTVKLVEDSQQLAEVVVTALGMSKERKKLGYSVSEIKAKDITLAPEVSTINALQGRVAGLQIDQGAGGPMGGSRIQIRGNSTLGKNNQPIFVIDGVILDNEITKNGEFGNDLKNLNMEDYESVSVLKGSSAAALYGSRAINGVILITTKKGKKRDGLGIHFSQSSTFYDPYKGPEFQNEYGGGSVGAFFTDWRDPGYKSNEQWRTKVFPTNSAGEPYIDPQIGREAENWGPRFEGQKVRNYDGTWTTWEAQPNNFLDAFQAGHSMRTNVAVDGGGEKTTFRISYTYEDNKGVTPGNKMVKNAINLRVTHDVNKYLGFDAGVDNTYTNSLNPEKVGIGDRYMWIYPRNFDTKYWTQRTNYIGKYGGLPQPNQHVDENNKAPGLSDIFSLYENNASQQENALRGRLAMNLNLTDWLKAVVEGNVNNLTKKRENENLGTEDEFNGGSYYIYQSQKRATFFKGYVAANKSFSDFNLSGYVGAETNYTEQTYTSAETQGGLNEPGRYYVSNSKNTPLAKSETNFKKRINSIYVSLDADYLNQFFLQATWRADWSSALMYPDGTGHPAYNYPAASLAWAFTETFRLPQWITYGKLRANIAALGNDTDPYKLNPGYKYADTYAYNQSTGQNVAKATFESSSALSLLIKPERKIAKEIGLEMNFFNNRLGFDLSLYRDNTYDQIMPLPTPAESGVSSIFINAGNIQNQGIEFSINYTPVSIKDFEWSGMFNIGSNRNKIIDLYEGRNEFDLGEGIHTMNSYAIVGKSYGIIRTNANSMPFQAVDATDNPVDHPNNGMPILSWRSDARCAFPGRSGEWMDIGDINASFRGGIENTLRYKNFSLQFLIDAKVGGDIVLYSYSFGTHTGLLPNTLAGRDASHGGITWTSAWDGEVYDDGMLPYGVFPIGQTVDLPNGGKADVGGMTYEEAYKAGYVEPTHTPQYFYRYGSWSTGPTDYWVFDNTWVALRQVSFNYRFPASVCSSLHINSLDLGIYGRDLGYLYNSLPYDFNPATNNSNSSASIGESGFLPMIRSFGGTLRVSF
ncbi:MAG: SusC/RagA family TonB-linked outer membrane protein [Tannerella sp.]|nr:SusC/RagA family TonB-linked outer membrane protein [Tannerella sp.]